MAGMETIHRIVEKFEVQDAAKTETIFDRIARTLEGKLGKGAGNAVKRVGSVVDDVKKKFGAFGKESSAGAGEAEQAVSKLEGGFGKMGAAAGKLGAVALIVYGAFKAVSFGAKLVWDGLQKIAHVAIESNLEIDAMGDQFTGLITTMTKLSGIKDPVERYKQSSEAASAVLGEFHGIAMKVAEPLSKISALGAKIEPFWTSLGKSQLDVVEATDAAASAAKVLGVDLDTASSSLFRLLRTGKAGKQDPFGMTLAAEAGIKKTDTLAQRADKLFKAMQKIGAPVREIAAGTDDALARWKILTHDILQRLTLPIYEKIGKLVGGIVEWTEKHHKEVDAVIDGFGELVEDSWGIAEGIWNAAAATAEWLNDITGVLDKVKGVAMWVKNTTHFAGNAGKAIKEMRENKAGGKPATRELADSIFEKLFGVPASALLVDKHGVQNRVKNVVGGLRASDKISLKEIDQHALDQAGIEINYADDKSGKSRLGRGSEDIRKLLASIFGNKRPILEMNVNKIEVQMDLRGEDSDAIMTDFVGQLERVGDAAVQSTVAGRAMAFGPGGVW